MCIMHKSEEYGKILLKQKDKQSNEQVKNFACKLAKQMPYSESVIHDSIAELLSEKVIFIEGDFICQKRMIKDNSISLIRSKAGKKGGEIAQAKIKANSEIEIEGEIDIDIDIIKIGVKKDFSVSIAKKFMHDKIYRIYDLREYFARTEQLVELELVKFNKFEEFMKANPAGVFTDPKHLYNAFKKFHTAEPVTDKKSWAQKMV